MTQNGTQVLDFLPNIEDPILHETEQKILDFLKKAKEPKLSKTISEKLDIPYGTTRRGLRNMMRMGLICQPLKTLRMGDLNSSGKINVSLSINKTSYLVR